MPDQPLPDPALPDPLADGSADRSDDRSPHRSAPVPQGRTSRLLHLGRALGGLALGAAAEGMSRLARGERPNLAQALLLPGQAAQLAERLSRMRGAAMKLGQLMSMDGQGVLPPQFAGLLGGLRDQAHRMPPDQLAQVLTQAYGADWRRRFRHFSRAPIAAASIGQVHRVETHDGRLLALKIQYPGVRASIDSDIANLALLARLPGLLPAGLDLGPLLARLRIQLLHETDYLAEARATIAYRAALGPDPVLSVPAVDAEHSSAQILATEFMTGVPVDRLADAPQDTRDRVAGALCRLAVRELFTLRLVQTDPNFGNTLYDAATGRIALLDFGATETVSLKRVAQLRAMGRAMRSDDADRVREVARRAGFIADADPPDQADGVVAMLRLAGEPLRQAGAYDFGASDLFARAFAQGQAQFFGAGFARTPPPDLVFLQRKVVGSFMLCSRLRASVDLGALLGAALGAAPVGRGR